MHRDKGVVLLTDRAWPDDDIERRILLDAGWHLSPGPRIRCRPPRSKRWSTGTTRWQSGRAGRTCPPTQSAVGLVLDRMRGISAFDRDVRNGNWNPAGARVSRLRSKTVGIVGYGRIGRATAGKLSGFGCRVIASDPNFHGDAVVGASSWTSYWQSRTSSFCMRRSHQEPTTSSAPSSSPGCVQERCW